MNRRNFLKQSSLILSAPAIVTSTGVFAGMAQSVFVPRPLCPLEFSGFDGFSELMKYGLNIRTGKSWLLEKPYKAAVLVGESKIMIPVAAGYDIEIVHLSRNHYTADELIWPQ